METQIKTDVSIFNDFYPQIKKFLLQDQATYDIDAEKVHGYRSPDCNAIWIRDHSDMLRGARYFEPDLLSGVSHFAKTQSANGAIFDFVSCAMDRENWTKYVRVPVEADVEYRFVKAIFLAWQATGDDQWLTWILPSAEKALHYTLNHPWRWSPALNLVKRAYTIDTWDFDYQQPAQPWLNFQITDQTHWGIFHGDNSGFYEAFCLIAQMWQHLGQIEKAVFWQQQAQQLRHHANQICWNGRFYTHRIPLDDFRLPGADEVNQLSLSNPMAINRGLATHEMAAAILREYRQRKKTTGAFAEWFSIDPPFPAGCFGDPKLIPGAYVNGGILPLVGGELARAALTHGFEQYGISILQQYIEMIRQTNATYLWYFPDGSPSTAETSTSPEATATDGWGSSAMLYAFTEGLVGVVDRAARFEKVILAPRWPIAAVRHAEVTVAYAASGAGLHYLYDWEPRQIRLFLEGPTQAEIRLLIPEPDQVHAVSLNQHPVDFQIRRIESTRYLVLSVLGMASAQIEVGLK